MDSDKKPKVGFKMFGERGLGHVSQTWESLFEDAARFADTVGPNNLINISHSSDKSYGVVTVWFWV